MALSEQTIGLIGILVALLVSLVIGTLLGVLLGPSREWTQSSYSGYGTNGSQAYPKAYFHKPSGRCYVALDGYGIVETGQDVCRKQQ